MPRGSWTVAFGIYTGSVCLQFVRKVHIGRLGSIWPQNGVRSDVGHITALSNNGHLQDIYLNNVLLTSRIMWKQYLGLIMDKPHCGEKTLLCPHAVGVGLCDSAPLLWRMEDLRSVRARGLVGTLLGSLPRTPRQNLRLGRPLLLLPEEERLLSEQRAAAVLPPFNQVSLTLTARDQQVSSLEVSCTKRAYATYPFPRSRSDLWKVNDPKIVIRDCHTNIFSAFELLASFSGDAEELIMPRRPFVEVICTLELSRLASNTSRCL